MATIVAARVAAGLSQVLKADDSVWSRAQPQTIALAPTPIGFQPSVYVVAAWRDRPYGLLADLSVRAVHTGNELAVRLEWAEPQPVTQPDDLDIFADGAALLFPMDGVDAPIESMGSPAKPVNAWYWRANLTAAIHATSQGAGSSLRLDDGAVSGVGRWDSGRWRVVLARAFSTPGGVQIAAPGTVNASFAVWRGANQERAGIKAFGQTWHEIRLEG